MTRVVKDLAIKTNFERSSHRSRPHISTPRTSMERSAVVALFGLHHLQSKVLPIRLLCPNYTQQTQRQLPPMAIYPISSSTEFLTAIFRKYGGMEILSTDQAVSLRENQVGHAMEPENITIRPLASGIWFLTCFRVRVNGRTWFS